VTEGGRKGETQRESEGGGGGRKEEGEGTEGGRREVGRGREEEGGRKSVQLNSQHSYPLSTRVHPHCTASLL